MHVSPTLNEAFTLLNTSLRHAGSELPTLAAATGHPLIRESLVTYWDTVMRSIVVAERMITQHGLNHGITEDSTKCMQSDRARVIPDEVTILAEATDNAAAIEESARALAKCIEKSEPDNHSQCIVIAETAKAFRVLLSGIR